MHLSELEVFFQNYFMLLTAERDQFLSHTEQRLLLGVLALFVSASHGRFAGGCELKPTYVSSISTRSTIARVGIAMLWFTFLRRFASDPPRTGVLSFSRPRRFRNSPVSMGNGLSWNAN
jgi:hypothetical protein